MVVVVSIAVDMRVTGWTSSGPTTSREID